MIIIGPQTEAFGIFTDSNVLIGLMIVDSLNQVVKDLRAYLILVLYILLVRWCAVPLREDAGCSILHALTQASAL